MATRIPASSVTVFTAGATSLLCKLENVDLVIEMDVEESSCLADFWKKPAAAGAGWSVQGAGMIDATPYFLPLMISAPTTALALTLDLGDAGTFTGNALIIGGTLSIARQTNIKEAPRLQGSGALAYAA